MKEIDICEMGTKIDLYFPEEPNINNFVSKPVLSNNLLYNLYSFI